MFVDASAIIAILTCEPEADVLTERLAASGSPITSAVAVFEAVSGVSRKRDVGLAEARRAVQAFLEAAEICLVSIGVDEAATALEAAARYGKGRGHPAQLNMGDCFAYAVAKNNNVSLLFKGDDFSRTDIASA